MLQGASWETKHKSLFSVLDEDHDGNINLDEMAEVRKNCSSPLKATVFIYLKILNNSYQLVCCMVIIILTIHSDILVLLFLFLALHNYRQASTCMVYLF